MSPTLIAAFAVGLSAAAFAVAGVAQLLARNYAGSGLYFGLALANGSLTLMQMGVK